MPPVPPFTMPEDWEPVPRLENRIKDLRDGGRYRTAMAELLQILRRDPSNAQAMVHALQVLYVSRTDLLSANEPLTADQRYSALLAPIAAQCSACTTFWYSVHVIIQAERTGTLGSRGVQCPVCRYTLCRECASKAPHEGTAIPCPAPGCAGMLKAAILPTGRRDVLPVDASRIERVIAVRDGPIPPTIGEALSAITRLVPLVADDAPLVLICRNVPGQMDKEEGARYMAWTVVDWLERDMLLAPGAWQRATSLRVRSPEDDSDYVLVIVELPPEPALASGGFLAGLLRENLQRAADGGLAGDGPDWTGLRSGDVIDATTALLLQTREAAQATNRLAARTRVSGRYIIASTWIPALSIQHAQDQFENGYFPYIEWLSGNFRFPGYGMSLAHWTALSDGVTTQLNLTFLPADNTEQALIAQDLMKPAERRRLGI